MTDLSIDYHAIVSQGSACGLEEKISLLIQCLPDKWCAQYAAMTGAETNIVEFNDAGFQFLFDLSSELVSTGVVEAEHAVEDRVVAVYGRSQLPVSERDSSRMAGFLGPTNKIFGDQYDKGHFMGHTLGGSLDVNLFPQRRHINRGWSERGKVYRAMERYCAQHPATFCFSRPIYADLSWRPCQIEYGVLTIDGGLWVEMFEN